MESSTEKIIRMLLTHPKQKWMQKDLAEKSNCSKAYLSKLMKKFREENIIARPYKNQVVLIGFSKLLNKWANMRKMQEPIYLNISLSEKEIEDSLKEEKDYALTLFRAAWYRTKFMRTDSFEIYAGEPEKFIKNFGEKVNEPTNFIVYMGDKQIFEFIEIVEGFKLVSVVQNYADLMSAGGSGVRVAYELAEKYDLMR